MLLKVEVELGCMGFSLVAVSRIQAEFFTWFLFVLRIIILCAGKEGCSLVNRGALLELMSELSEACKLFILTTMPQPVTILGECLP